MKKTRMLTGLSLIAVAGLVLIAADHVDAPAVTGTANDITDLYAFQGENTNNMVFIVGTQGFLSPGATGTTAGATFNENMMVEINIDNTGDNVEDLVIQAIRRGSKMYFFGPTAPGTPGMSSMVKTNAMSGSVDITAYGSSPVVATQINGMKMFAGPRDDPFFFDLGAYSNIIMGNATGFSDPGTDTFAGTNILATVIEVPKSMLGTSETINVWAESKQKQ
ncbi:MAG TPA: DUF4331 family protein [Flavobacterium sp.]